MQFIFPMLGVQINIFAVNKQIYDCVGFLQIRSQLILHICFDVMNRYYKQVTYSWSYSYEAMIYKL